MKTFSTRDPAFDDAWAKLCARGSEEDEGGVSAAAAAIVADVRARGDAALLDLTARFDGWAPEGADALVVEPPAFARAFAALPPAARRALRTAARRIVAFHRRERDAEVPPFTDPEGSRLGQVTRPLRRVGLYAPGGTARYPSTVLMTALPARVAGVPEIFVCSPAVKGSGEVDAWTLAACHVAGVAQLFKIGGAQAVAALAHGTATVPAVDKICGPGNAYVAAAKRLVFGRVDIDMIAGPTEVVVVAGPRADPAEVASDLLAQAEHDARAVPVLLTPSPRLAEAVEVELARQLASLPRRAIAERALAERGAMVVTRDVAEAVRLADDFAPEHLALLLPDARRWVKEISARWRGVRRKPHPGGGGRLRCGTEPRAPHRRHRPLRLPALGGHLPAPHERPRALPARARRAGAGRLCPGRGRGPRGARPRRSRQARPPRAGEAAGLRWRRAPRRHPASCEEERLPVSWRDHLRPSLGGLGVYRPFDYASAPAGLIRLDANEAAYPLAPEEVEAFRAELARVDARRYPEVSGRPLREALARRWGVAPEQLLLGNGSDEIIDRLVTAFGAGTPGAPATVLFPVPTFGEYESLAQVHGARPLPVPLDARFALDEEALAIAVKAHRPALAFFATPNNPTGNRFDPGVLERLARLMDAVLVADEAYADFEGETLLGRVGEVPGLFVMRSLSKVGFAGLRLGALVGPREAIAELDKARLPYNVNALSLALAAAALARPAALEARIRATAARRRELEAALREQGGLDVFPSQANFVLVRTETDAHAVWERLLARGVLVRDLSRPGPLANCLRITAGTEEENAACVSALREVLA